MVNDSNLDPLNLNECARLLLKQALQEPGPYLKYYEKYNAGTKIHLAKNHSLINKMLCLGDQHEWKKGVVNTLHQTFITYFSQNFKPKTRLYNSFFDWLSPLRSAEELKRQSLIADYLNKKVRGSEKRRISDETISLLEKTIIATGKGTAKQFASAVNQQLNGVTVSTSWVKKYLASPRGKEFRNIMSKVLNGEAGYRDNQRTPQRRLSPKFALSQVQIDGSDLKFAVSVLDNLGKMKAGYLTYFIVVDIMSKKIIGTSTDYTENYWMVLKALEDSVRSTGYLPGEIVADNASSFKKQEIKSFLTKADLFESMNIELRTIKMIFNKVRNRNPMHKAQVESVNSILQRLMLQDPKFIGLSVKAKRTEHRQADEYILKLRHKDFILSVEEANTRFNHWVNVYNNTVSEKDGLSPNQRFESAEVRNAIPVKDYELPILFHKQTKITIRRGLIIFAIRKEEVVFELNTPDEKNKLNNTKVNVYYDEDDLSEVTITDQEDLNPIRCKRQPMPQIAYYEQTENDKQIFRERAKRHKEEQQHSIEAIAKIAEEPNIAQAKSLNKVATHLFLNRQHNDPLNNNVQQPSDEEMIEKITPIRIEPDYKTSKRWSDDDDGALEEVRVQPNGWLDLD